MDFEISAKANKEADDFIANETRIYNSQFVPNDFALLSVYCRDDASNIVGGLTGKTYWNYLDIGFLWVERQNRKSRIASKLLRLAEEEAKRRGCHFSMLDTYEFQGLEFYLKQGYQEFGRLKGYCEIYKRYYRKKIL